MKTKEEILAAIVSRSNFKTEAVDTPAWGKVYVRCMSAGERDELEISVSDKDGDKTSTNMRGFRAKLVARCVVDEQGARVFVDEDADMLEQEAAHVISPVFDVAAKLNGFSKGDVEELAKN